MIRILHGDCRDVLRTLPDQSVQCVVTSPPYFGLRDYGVAGQIGLEPTPSEYVAQMVEVFRMVRDVLRDDGVFFLNLGDSYAGSWGARGRSEGTNAPRADLEEKHGTAAPARNGFASLGIKPKDLMGIPWRVTFALQEDGWYLRSAIVWAKPNPMPESVTDRPTSAYEMVFLLTKNARYFYDADAVREDFTGHSGGVGGIYEKLPPVKTNTDRNDGGGYMGRPNADGRNARNVWTIPTQPFSGAHFATMPPDLAERCIKAGSRPGDTILDPFSGAGTTAMVADRLGRNAIGIELNQSYAEMSRARVVQDAGLFAEIA